MGCLCCDECYKDYVSACVENVVVFADLEPLKGFEWVLTDSFDNVYVIPFTSDEGGSATIDLSALPEGFANPAQGPLFIQLRVSAADCECLDMFLDPTDVGYSCIELTFKGGTANKDFIGCRARTLAEWSWSATDPKAEIEAGTFEFIPQGSSMLSSYSDSIIADVHLMPARQYVIIRVPSLVEDKTAWFDTGAPMNAGAIPDQVFYPIIVQGGFDWYVNSVPMIYDSGESSRLKLTKN